MIIVIISYIFTPARGDSSIDNDDNTKTKIILKIRTEVNAHNNKTNHWKKSNEANAYNNQNPHKKSSTEVNAYNKLLREGK